MNHEVPPSGRCAHRNYRLTCEDYDAFVVDFGGRCAICRREGHETGHGVLFIDHDPFVGDWAVRGLLCNGCNVRVCVDYVTTPEDAAYLANPWYRQWFAMRGVDITVQPEPPAGDVVYTPAGRGGLREWRHSGGYWISRQFRHCSLSWAQLNQRYGPHQIVV